MKTQWIPYNTISCLLHCWQTQKRSPKARATSEATAVGTNKVVASDVGLGAGESAADAAMINMAMTTKKSFIFNASIFSLKIKFGFFSFLWEIKETWEDRGGKCTKLVVGGENKVVV